MEIAATTTVTVTPQSHLLSHAFSKNLGSLSSFRFNLPIPNPNLRLRMSTTSMNAFTTKKISPESYLDNKETKVLHFVKYHGLGNDFILVDNMDSLEPKITQEQAVKLCDRNFGVGADGVIFAMPGVGGTDYTMRIFNSDGSEPEMCGNGVRCFARFIAEIENLQGKHSFTIHTGAGLIIPEIQEDGQVKVDMGEPILRAEDVPTRLMRNKGESVVAGELVVDGVSWNVTCVSMGNPHCITFGTKDGQELSVNELKKEANVLHSLANKQIDRVFTFDKVFGPKSQQRSIYDQAIAPIVHEVLEGFSCTVFAYGQTGTGKTYTMEGGMRNKGAELPAEAGVIPRAVKHIFETLESQNADYNMKVTFLELYNEEVTDLLAQEDSADKQRKVVSLMEDGKGCVVLRGLEEEVVYSANDIYALLERGSSKRRTADTLLNKRSSRSHSVFTITVYIKEESMGDEELIKCGKLNLVDLAGSENILRSGSRDGRAREAGEINKSLLTLGRVINALVEHSSHIPYRDSKLTRLLRDSLGGKTKTCIIATISPSAHSLEETLSTLDYAYRAKNIKNKPEANQKLSKAVLLKDLYLELERMKEDVRAARDKNGIYIAQERYAQEEAEKKVRIQRIEQLENDLNLTESEVSKYRDLYENEKEKLLDVESDLKDCKRNLDNSNKELFSLKDNYIQVISKLQEREDIISSMKASGTSLIDRAKGLRSDLQHASDDIGLLFTRLDQKDNLEYENRSMLLKFGSQLDQNLKDLHRTVLGSVSQQQQQLRVMEEHAHSFLARKYDATHDLESRIGKTADTYTSGVTALKELSETLQNQATSDLEMMNSSVGLQIEAVEQFLTASATEATKVAQDIRDSLNDQKELLALAARQQEQGLVRSMRSAQEISNAASTIFSNIYNQAHDMAQTIKASQVEKTKQLTVFEMKFKEEAKKEEKQALDEISLILSKLTSKKTAMVSDASRSIREHDIQEEKKMQEKMSGMQQVSIGAKEELFDYLKKAKTQFTENTVASAESITAMDNYLDDCLGRANESKSLWENTETGVKNLNLKYKQELNVSLGDMAKENERLHDEFASTFSSMDANIVTRTNELHAAVNDSLMQDRENKETTDAMVEICMKQITSLQENHGQAVSNVRSKAEQSLIKDYQVDQHKNKTPKKQAINVPSLASIEEMRTLFSQTMVNEDYKSTEKKSSKQEEANRTPFLEVNI